MKPLLPLLLLGAIPASGQSAYVNFIRQHQQGTSVVWDMPVAPTGQSPSALTMERGGALFQLWTIEQSAAKEHLLDQKLVGACLPAADVKITTLDPYSLVARTRVDQPFTVEIHLNGLLTGVDLPLSATSVLLEKHIAPYPNGSTVLSPAAVASNPPANSAYLSDNGKNVLKFAASSLTAPDPTKASGEEHFIIHALTDGSTTQTQIASAFVQIWPVASGTIKGITHGETLRSQTPTIELQLNDLYPRSDTSLLLFEGTQIHGVPGTTVKTFPMDRETSESHVIPVTELDSMITKDGTYTLALISETVFGRELLTDAVTFHVDRKLHANAMNVNRSDERNP